VSILDAVHQGLREASTTLTQSLRQSAYEQGWSADAGRSLNVNYDGKSYRIEMSQEAENTEYGDMNDPPSPAVRKWSNNTADIEAAIIEAVDRRLEGLL
jgi:hypothetical protein